MKEIIPVGERKWIDIPTNKFYREDAFSADFFQKLVMRLGRPFDQDEREIDGAVHWDSMGPKFAKCVPFKDTLVGRW